MVGRYAAGAANLPFWPLRSAFETDLPRVNPNIRPVASPFGGEAVFAVPPLRPDVAVIHAQRADAAGNTQIWGLTGCQKEGGLRRRPGRWWWSRSWSTRRWCGRPQPDPRSRGSRWTRWWSALAAPTSYAQGYYDRDNRFYLEWDRISRDPGGAVGLAGRVGPRHRRQRRVHLDKLGAERVGRADPGPGPVRVGRLRGLPLMAGGSGGLKERSGSSPGEEDWSKNEMLVVAGPGPGRAAGVLRRHRPAQHRRGPGPADRGPRDRAGLRVGGVRARPARLPLSIGDPCLVTGATAAMSMVELFGYYLQGGLVDVGFLGAAQLDRFGNINTTVIGDYAQPKVRLPGSGGRARSPSTPARCSCLCASRPALFVERIDFRTSPGNLGGPPCGPPRAGRAAAPRWSSPTWAATASTPTPARWSWRPSTPGCASRRRSGRHRLGAAGGRRPPGHPGPQRPRSCG